MLLECTQSQDIKARIRRVTPIPKKWNLVPTEIRNNYELDCLDCLECL